MAAARDRLATCCAAVLLAITTAATLVACSDSDSANADGDDVPSVTETVTVTETIDPPPTYSANGTPTDAVTESPATGPVPSIDGPVVAHEVVTSPSGNIMCTLEYGLECWIDKNDYDPMSRGDCEYDWLDYAFTVTDSGAERGVCRSDYPFGADPVVLPYGTTTVVRDQACMSTESGMTCWNRSSKHGFRISRASYTLF